MEIPRIILLIAGLLAGSQDAQKPAAGFKKPSEPVFIVTVNKYASGFRDGKPTSQFGDLLLIGLVDREEPPEDARPHGDENPASYFYATTYLHPGARFKVFHGGAPAGAAVVADVVDLQCDSRAGRASLEGTRALSDEEYALASNGKQINTHPNRQRMATKAEETIAVALAKKVYLEKGAPHFMAKQIEVRRLIYTEVDNSRQGLLAGTFYVRTESAAYELFAIFGAKGKGWRVEFARYNRATDLEDEKDSNPEIFVDQLDLDGDGIDELVTEVSYYEAEDFRILKRFGEHWREVHKGGAGGC